jgi:SAM-dependent methyltransferase
MVARVMTCPVCASVDLHAMRAAAGRPLVRCGRCRLVFAREPALAPAMREQMSDAERRLEERVAERRRPLFAALLRAAGRPGRLLDVGCGVGRLLEVAREAGWQAVGVDVDPAMAAYARERGLDVRLGRLRALRLPAASFDLVTLWNVIDFVPEPLGVLQEIFRLLAPGGRVLVRTPNVPVQLQGVRLTRLLAALGMGPLVRDRPRWLGIVNASNFGAPALRIALERAGFIEIDVRNSRPIPGDPYLSFGQLGETAIGLGKRALFVAAQAAARATGGRWLLAPSLEGSGRRPA